MALRLEDQVFRILENQGRFFEFLDEHRWDFNMDAGHLVFTSQAPRGLFARLLQGKDRVISTVPVQLIGSESDADKTWLWAWANEQSGIPDRLLKGIGRVKAAAADEGNPLFLQAEEIPLRHPRFGAELAIICMGFLGYFTYYACSHSAGALYVAIPESPDGVSKERNAVQVINTLNQGISALEFQHKPAVLAYLGKPSAREGETFGWDIGSDRVRVAFDTQGRISEMSTQVRGST